MTREKLLQIRRKARRHGGFWDIGLGFALAVLPDGRIRITGNGGSSYFASYAEFYRWVRAGAPTQLGRLCSDVSYYYDD